MTPFVLYDVGKEDPSQESSLQASFYACPAYGYHSDARRRVTTVPQVVIEEVQYGGLEYFQPLLRAGKGATNRRTIMECGDGDGPDCIKFMVDFSRSIFWLVEQEFDIL
ncbi:predicted protein [Histoplasma capsulatum var. duboisii H88]|uniref:Predicted protein n=1 Tax=Ajellomyces capsulatus (strain H88) TaxID=544711 RepID=F0UF22_AJEC8|nr:predicted protein [Histoplasma capsulatum var. duboisii H88]